MDNELTRTSYVYLVYDEEREYDEAIAALTAFLADDPGNVQALNNRGVAYRELGALRPARVDLDNAVRLAVHDHIPLVNRGMLRELEADYAGAIGDYSDAIAMRPTDSTLYNRRAGAYQALGQHEEAQADRARAATVKQQPEQE